MMPSDYAYHLEDADRAQLDHDNATGLRIIAATVLGGWGAVALLAAAVLVLVGAVGPVFAAPNDETQLPADGVTSIERSGDTWTVTTTSPASEIKYMEPGPQQIICGTNYGMPCTTVETFTASGSCVYLQLDGIAYGNSSDPYVCRGGTPSTPTPTPSETPTSTPSPTSTQTPTSIPTPSPTATAPVVTTPASSPIVSASMADTVRTPSTTAEATPAPAQLAATGQNTDLLPALIWIGPILLALGIFSLQGARRFFPGRFDEE